MIAKRRDLRGRDQLADGCAAAVKRVDVPPKVVAQRLGVDDRSARRWASQGKGNPLYPAAAFIDEVARVPRGHVYEIIGYFKAVAFQGLICMSDDAALVARFWALLSDEGLIEGEALSQQTGFGKHGNLHALEAALQRSAARREELAAVCMELREREIDPRTYGGRA